MGRGPHGARGAPVTAAEALRRLQAAGRVKAAWLPGMSAIEDGIWWRACNYGWVGGYNDGGWAESVGKGAVVDLSDPATVGCLLALLREVVAPWTPDDHSGAETTRGLPGWGVWVQTGPGARDLFTGPTEGEAIVSALVWLAVRP